MAVRRLNFALVIFFGALTGQGGIDGKSVGKINSFAMRAYVAAKRSMAKKALGKIESGKMKGRQFRARI